MSMAVFTEIAFGRLNYFFFVVGALLNILLCITKYRKIKTPVDVCVMMICLSNWVTVFLDLFVGIQNTNSLSPEQAASPFYSFEFTQFWGFVKMTNWEWMTALMALLPLTNAVLTTRLQPLILGAGWFVVECILMAIPIIHGGYFEQYSYYPTPSLDYRPLVGDEVGSAAFLAWYFLVEFLPYAYFILVTFVMLLVNCINYSNARKGYVTSTPEQLLDTKVTMAYCLFYLLTEFPGMVFYAIFTFIMVFDWDVSCHRLLLVGHRFHIVHLFLSTARCVVIPLIYLLTKHGVHKPVRYVLDTFNSRVRYMKFHEEHNITLTEVEDNEEEP